VRAGRGAIPMLKQEPGSVVRIEDGKAAIRRWRSDRALGTVEMDDLALAMNEALGTLIDEKTTRMIRRRGRYVSTHEIGKAAR